MNTELAKFYGWEAFKAGQPRAPRADAAFCAMATTLDETARLACASAFQTGWENAKTARAMAAMNRAA